MKSDDNHLPNCPARSMVGLILKDSTRIEPQGLRQVGQPDRIFQARPLFIFTSLLRLRFFPLFEPVGIRLQSTRTINASFSRCPRFFLLRLGDPCQIETRFCFHCKFCVPSRLLLSVPRLKMRITNCHIQTFVPTSIRRTVRPSRPLLTCGRACGKMGALS